MSSVATEQTSVVDSVVSDGESEEMNEMMRDIYVCGSQDTGYGKLCDLSPRHFDLSEPRS